MNLLRARRKKPAVKPDSTRLSLWDKYKLLKLIRDPIMLQKLKSRKLWITVVTAALMAFGEGMGIDPELLNKILYMAMTYVGGESLVDAAYACKAA
jgi:hypothetical protein